MSGVARDHPGWVLMVSSRLRVPEPEFPKSDLAHFPGQEWNLKKVELKDREFVSATISGAGGANHASQAGSSMPSSACHSVEHSVRVNPDLFYTAENVSGTL